LFTKEPIETNHFGNFFTKELVESHIGDMIVSKPVKKRTSYNLSNQEPIEEYINNLLKKQPVEKVFINPILAQTNDVLINLVTCVSFLKKVCPKGCNVFQTPPFLTPWL